MPNVYTINTGDTLSRIAARFYGGHGINKLAEIGSKLATYNGIKNPDLIKVGEVIDIPPFYELFERQSQDMMISVPNGLGEICNVFGDPDNFLVQNEVSDHVWMEEMTTMIDIPFGIPLSWDMGKIVRRIRVHRLLDSVFTQVFSDIDGMGGSDVIRSFGGSYAFRVKRGGRSKYSTHAWGVAIDLNPLTNSMGFNGDQPMELVNTFRRYGFKWGGDWYGHYCDPMHFQYCTGY